MELLDIYDRDGKKRVSQYFEVNILNRMTIFWWSMFIFITKTENS